MPETDTTQRRDKILIAALAVLTALVTLAVYIPALRNGFVNWDDPTLVYDNVHIRSIDLGLLKWAFTNTVIASWFPLTVFSFALDYAVWGLDPWGFHLTNNVLHALNTALVFILCVRLVQTGRPHQEMRKALITATVAALLFGLHPLHVESVAWVTERKDVLYSLFFLLSVLVYLKYVSSSGLGRRLLYALALCLFAMSLMSKSMAVTLPVVLLVLDYYPLRRLSFKWAVVEKIPFLFLSLLVSLMTAFAGRPDGLLGPLKGHTVLERLFLPARNYIFYLYKMVLPVRLAPYYPYPVKASPFAMEYVLALVLFAAITLLGIWTYRRQRVFSAAWLYYLLTLLPIIGLMRFSGFVAADRYTYLPSLGPFMLAGLGAAYLMGTGGRRRMVATACVTAVILATLAAMTVRQTGVWKDSITLWSHEASLYPDRAPVAYYNRGLAYAKVDDLARAIEDYSTAIAIRPGHTKSYYNRGLAYGMQGRYDLALEDYNTAIRIGPKYAKGYTNRGLTYGMQGRYDRALEDYNTAIRVEPEYVKAYINRGVVYGMQGRYDLAIEDLDTAILLGPGNKEAYYNRARVYELTGRYRLAIDDLTATIKIDPAYADAYNNRAVVYLRLGNYGPAIEDSKKAVELDPGMVNAYFNLGLAYLRLGDTSGAALNFNIASELGSTEARDYLRNL